LVLQADFQVAYGPAPASDSVAKLNHRAVCYFISRVFGGSTEKSLDVSCTSKAGAGELCNEIAEKSCAPGASLPSDQYHDENNQKYYNKNGPPIMAHHFLQFSFPF